MLIAFWEVLKDLWFFVLGKQIQQPDAAVAVSVDVGRVDKQSDTEKEKIVPEIKYDTYDSELVSGQKVFVRVDGTPCLQKPFISYDTVVGRLKYGEEVYVDDLGKDFVHVQSINFSGWVESSSLTDSKSLVYPEFKSGYVYGDSNREVVKLRQYLKDELLGGELGLALQPEEYVVYRLNQRGSRVAWPQVRPRLAGDWKTILKGVRGATISLTPHTGSVLEMIDDDNSGFLAMVEEVKPDNSIKITGVGREREGELREEVLAHAEWIEWRPVFITFT